jgi:hypothetical protein
MLRVTGDTTDVLAIRLQKRTKSVPYSYDDDVNNNNNNYYYYYYKTKVIVVLIVATGTTSKLFRNT